MPVFVAKSEDTIGWNIVVICTNVQKYAELLDKGRMALNELDALTWRAVALLLPDPTSFASCCKRASKTVDSSTFRLEWFAAHNRCVGNTIFQAADNRLFTTFSTA